MDRRTAIRSISGAAVGSILAASPFRAGAAPRRAPPLVIDGNLVAPIDPGAPLDPATSASVRSAGLNAFKMTLGGSGNQNKAQTEAELADLARGVAINGDLFLKITSAGDLDAARRSGRTGIIFSFEAAEMLEGQLDNIAHFRASGVLVMGLSYNGNTPFASGVLAQRPTGLTDLGRQAVARMNTLGITVDLSHSDEATGLGALAIATRPLVITHAGCSAVQPNPRNKSDALLRRLASQGGVVGIYELSFLATPPAQPTLDDYLAHLSHALAVCGEDHVGIGTDGMLTPFDTSPASMKAWNDEIARRRATGVGAPGEGPPPFVIGLNRPDRYAIIADGLRRRGYHGRVVDKVLGSNFERVFRETWRPG